MSKKLDHWIVYGLFDPTTNAIRYIGQTSYKVHHRLARHLYEAKHQQVCDAKREWILALLAGGLRPVIRSLEIAASESDAHAGEDRQIQLWMSEGASLLNETNGGPGSRGRVLRASTKAKIGEANRGREGGFKGRFHTPEAKAKVGDANRGRPNPMKGKKHAPEFGAKLRAIKASRPNPLKGRSMPEETKAKIRAAKLGKPLSPETREKMRAGHARRALHQSSISPSPQTSEVTT